MSQEWLDIQSFFADNQILRAITDLSLATKYEVAGIRDEERARAGAADDSCLIVRIHGLSLQHVGSAVASSDP